MPQNEENAGNCNTAEALQQHVVLEFTKGLEYALKQGTPVQADPAHQPRPAGNTSSVQDIAWQAINGINIQPFFAWWDVFAGNPKDPQVKMALNNPRWFITIDEPLGVPLRSCDPTYLYLMGLLDGFDCVLWLRAPLISLGSLDFDAEKPQMLSIEWGTEAFRAPSYFESWKQMSEHGKCCCRGRPSKGCKEGDPDDREYETVLPGGKSMCCLVASHGSSCPAKISVGGLFSGNPVKKHHQEDARVCCIAELSAQFRGSAKGHLVDEEIHRICDQGPTIDDEFAARVMLGV